MKRLLCMSALGAVCVAGMSSSAQADSRFDGRLRDVIEDRFFNDSRVLSSNISVETRDQEVTLRGTVGSPAERAAAVNIVTATPGVRKLVNELEVEPAVTRSDDEIQRDALQLAAALEEIQGSSVVLGVSEQTVTIQGVYPTLTALDQVVSAMTSIQGVKDVKVRAAISPPAPVTDDHLRTAVAQSLMNDGTVDAAKIRVGVRDGFVVLEGEVPSLFQLQRAASIVRNLTGVRGLRNGLQLAPTGRSVG